jgi:hypothetical protein
MAMPCVSYDGWGRPCRNAAVLGRERWRRNLWKRVVPVLNSQLKPRGLKQTLDGHVRSIDNRGPLAAQSRYQLRTVKFDSMYEYMIKYANLSAVQRTQSATEELNSGLDQGLLFGYKALSSTLNPASLSAYLLPKRVVSLIPPFSGTDGRCLNWYATCLNMLRCKQCLLLATV